MNQITNTDIARLRDLLGDEYSLEADRGRFYLAVADLYKGTDAFDQVMMQAQITTYSGAIGGGALLGNNHGKQQGGSDYDVTLDEFSWEIAERLLISIEADVNEFGGTGIFTADEVQLLDYSVWQGKGIGHLFPGNIQLIDELLLPTPIEGVVRKFLPDGPDDRDLVDLMGGYLRALPGIALHADEVGSKPVDYGFIPNDSIDPAQFQDGEIVQENEHYRFISKNNGETMVVESKLTGNVAGVYHAGETTAADFGLFLGTTADTILQSPWDTFVRDSQGNLYSQEQIDAIKNYVGAHLNTDGLRYALDKVYQGSNEEVSSAFVSNDAIIIQNTITILSDAQHTNASLEPNIRHQYREYLKNVYGMTDAIINQAIEYHGRGYGIDDILSQYQQQSAVDQYSFDGHASSLGPWADNIVFNTDDEGNVSVIDPDQTVAIGDVFAAEQTIHNQFQQGQATAQEKAAFTDYTRQQALIYDTSQHTPASSTPSQASEAHTIPIGAFYDSQSAQYDHAASIAEHTGVLLDSQTKPLTVAQLQALDSNHDGQLSGAETATLRLWQDSNENGHLDNNELTSLTQLSWSITQQDYGFYTTGNGQVAFYQPAQAEAYLRDHGLPVSITSESASSHADNPSAGRREYVPIGLSSASMPQKPALGSAARLPITWCVFQDYYLLSRSGKVMPNSSDLAFKQAA